MKAYVFIGTYSIVGNVEMTRFAQRFGMSDEAAMQGQRGGAPLLSNEDFLSVGFTDKELRVWADPFMSEFEVPTKPEDAAEKAVFLAKKEKALEMYRAIQLNLLTDKPSIEPEAPAMVPAADNVTEEVNE